MSITDTTPPVVIVTRHPDYGTDVDIHGCDDMRVINIDLGASFDMGESPQYGDAEEALEYADELEEEVADLPEAHPARMAVADVADDIRAWARGEDR